MNPFSSRRKTDTGRPTARPQTAKDLQKELTDAVKTGKPDAVRTVLDAVFWNKQDGKVKPTGFHLLVAAQSGNRSMVQLLTTHGATWTREEAKIARLIVGDEKLDRLQSVLMAAGIDTRFSPEELKNVDLLTAMRWRHESRHLDPVAAYGSGVAATPAETELAFVFMQDKNAELRPFIDYRDERLGNGTYRSPLNVDRDFSHILLRRGKDDALAFLQALCAREGLCVKPIAGDGYSFWGKPGVISPLAQADMLARNQPRRLTMLEEWSVLEEEATFAHGYTVRHTKEHVQERHAEFKTAAAYLFGAHAPLSAQEAEAFIDLHNRRIQFTPVALSRMEEALMETGFFKGDGWTPERLARLATHGGTLGHAFNKMAVSKKIRTDNLSGAFNKKKFDTMISAIKEDALTPVPFETNEILHHVATHMKRDVVTKDVQDVLALLRDKHADFCTVCPDDFLGKTAPGLAKALLDGGFVNAMDFDLGKVIARAGGKLKLITGTDKKTHAYTEFACQLILESKYPDKYIPQRGEADAMRYQGLFIREWLKGLKYEEMLRYVKKRPPLYVKFTPAPKRRYPPPPPPPPSRRVHF